MTDNQRIGERIKSARIAAKKTQGDVAVAVGVATSTILRYEAGDFDKIKIPVIQSIARALGVSPDWLALKCDDMHGPISTTTRAWGTPLLDAYEHASIDTQRAACAVLRIPRVVPNSMAVRDLAANADGLTRDEAKEEISDALDAIRALHKKKPTKKE
ncbi:helix-turn-helix domain-containing protein [Bacillota bacterium Meth-B3]